MFRQTSEHAALAVVWIDILPSDSEASARRATALLDDPRVTHFYDADQHAGRVWAEALGIQGVAWDVYMVFDGDAQWKDHAPAPHEWFHQLGGNLADPVRLRTANMLAQSLHQAGRSVGWPVATEAPSLEHWSRIQDAALARLHVADPEADDRCAECRAASQLSSCSLGGWRRLLLRLEGGGGQFIASPVQRLGDPDGRRELRLAVTGMRCPECMMRAGAGALSVQGVDEVEVRLDDGSMRVLIAFGATAEDEEVAAAVREQGFEARRIAESHESG